MTYLKPTFILTYPCDISARRDSSDSSDSSKSSDRSESSDSSNISNCCDNKKVVKQKDVSFVRLQTFSNYICFLK